ncbi:MAG: hypothetical protein V1760_01590 [Candidatus Peregrinibacteria bacterium]
MDPIEKFVRKPTQRQARRAEQVLIAIVSLQLKGYEAEKMTGFKDLYRIRIGKIRIIFRKTKERGVPIDIDYRGRVYKKYR